MENSDPIGLIDLDIKENAIRIQISPSCIRLSRSLTGQAAAISRLLQVVVKTWVEQVHPALNIQNLRIYVRQYNQMKSQLVILQEGFFSYSGRKFECASPPG